MPHAVFCSFRFGTADGVSVVAASWIAAFHDLGWTTSTVAGEGHADRIVPGLGIEPTTPPEAAELADAFASADLVVVENLLTIPLNLPASAAVADALRGRPALLHHHDPPWQRDRFAQVTALPVDDRAWRHVTINHLTERQFADRHIITTTIYNGFDVDEPHGSRAAERDRLGIDDRARLVLHPVRAIARKNVPAAMALAAAVGATYWLPGPAEEGYGPELAGLLATAPCPVLRTPMARRADAYAACDAVVFPSTWEGFGNPPIEAAIFHRPVAVGSYPVAEEVRALGFWWLPIDDPAALAVAMAEPSTAMLGRNHELARQHFSQARVVNALGALLDDAGWNR